jgi:hypothetical protein
VGAQVSTLPPLPPGFTLDTPQATIPPLPPGFTLDAPQAPGGTDTPPLARAPELMGQPEERGLGRSLMLGAQAAGRGLVEAALSPIDLAARAANVPLMAADMVADQFGGRVPFRFGEDLGDRAANTAGKLAESVGVPLATPDKGVENAIYQGTRFGTQALASSGAAGALAKVLNVGDRTNPVGFGMDALLAPYGSKGGGVARTMTGDAAAGTGAGVGLAASQDYLPQEYRDAGGGLGGLFADLAAMTVGGTGGGIASEIVRGLPVSAGRRIMNSFSDGNLPVDPETGIPFTRGQAQRAAKDVQGAATDPAAAAARIGERAAYYDAEGLPMPTSGIMSDDIGVIGVEQGQRRAQSTRQMINDPDMDPATKARYNFGERDQALQTRAVEEVQGLIPDGSNPRAFTDRADEVARTQRDVAQRGVDQAAGQQRGIAIARSGPAADVQAFEGQGAGASANIDRTVRDTRTAELEQSRQLFNDPTLTGAEVPVDPMRATAGEIAAVDTPAAPLAPVVQKYVQRFGAIDEGTPITMREVNANRAEIEADIAANLDNGAIVSQLRQLKDTVNRYATDLEATDGPAADAARAANQNYSERVAPNFRSGAGGQFDRAVKTERAGGAPVRPSETAERFLTTPEDASDLMRIAELRGNRDAVAGQARTWLFDQLARKGIGRDGAVDAEALTRWRNRNDGLLAAVPGLRAEVNQMVAAARRGEGLADDAATALRTAEQRATTVDQNIRRGPLGMVEGTAPPQAVDNVLGSRDPRGAMRELVSTVGRNPEARNGLKNAVASRLIRKVTTALGDRLGQRAAKVFEDNREALAEIYSPEEMNRLVRAQRLVEPLDNLKIQATTGSATAERSSNWLPLEVIAKIRYGMLKGGGIISNAKKTVGALTAGQDQTIERIKLLATFDPEAAQHLLTLKTQKPNTPGYNATLQKLIRRNEALNTLNEDDKERNEITVTPRPQ